MFYVTYAHGKVDVIDEMNIEHDDAPTLLPENLVGSFSKELDAFRYAIGCCNDEMTNREKTIMELQERVAELEKDENWFSRLSSFQFFKRLGRAI